MKKKLFTVLIFVKISTRRFFRDRLALFFTIIFPLIFLFVFGGIFGKNSTLSFKVGILNHSDSAYSKQYVEELKKSSMFKVDSEVVDDTTAQEKMSRGEIDATIVLPADFGVVKNGQYPSGQAEVHYTQNNEQAGQTLVQVMSAQFQEVNKKFVHADTPFTVEAKPIHTQGLSRFDYTFAGLLGFSIIGLGIFGPVNVFPELKKQGILRRLHTTPLRVWQYFSSTAISQAIVGLLTMAIMFVVAIAIFHLHVIGSWLALAAFLAFSIITILGIGLAIGGWAKNERQAAPLANIIVFPMLFLSGTFFPRYVMPEWLQKVSAWLPLTPVIDGIRMIATEGKTLLEIGPQIGLLTLWFVIIYVIAFRVFRWE